MTALRSYFSNFVKEESAIDSGTIAKAIFIALGLALVALVVLYFFGPSKNMINKSGNEMANLENELS